MVRPPIFVWEDGDLGVYESVEHAEGAIESPDVEDGIYSVFDSQGCPLHFDVLRPEGERERPSRSRLLGGLEVYSVWPVKLRAIEGTPNHGQELREILLRAFELSGAPAEDMMKLSLPQLVDEAFARFRRPGARTWGGR